MIDWREKVKAAHVMVSALCKPRGSHGSREWIMSIPARPEHDPDLVITFGLMAAEKHIKELEAQLAACAAGPWRFDVENAPKGVVLLVAHKHHSQDICRLTFATYEVDGPYPGQQDDYVWRERFEHDRQLSVFAFAVPNPPQVTTGKAFDIPEWRDNDSGGYVQ